MLYYNGYVRLSALIFPFGKKGVLRAITGKSSLLRGAVYAH